MVKLKQYPSHQLLIFIFIFILFLAAVGIQGIKGSRVQIALRDHNTSSFKDGWRRLLIGSIAPICSYNECRGCKYRCISEQVPVEGNDPINSSYYYKCVCHR